MVKLINKSKTRDFKEAAYTILRPLKQPLHVSEIVRIAKSAGVLITDDKTPVATMRTQLNSDIAALGESSRFKKYGPAIFGLNIRKNKEN